MKLTIEISDNTYEKIKKMANNNEQQFVELLVEQFSMLQYIEWRNENEL